MSDSTQICEVVLKMNVTNREYSVDSSIQYENQNITFFLFMIDKILVDCIERKTAQNILANSVCVMIGEGKVFAEVENVFNKFKQVSSIDSYEFQMEFKLLSKTSPQGEHLYISNSYKPMMVPNIDGKTAILSGIYAMHLRNTLSHDTVGILNIALGLAFEE